MRKLIAWELPAGTAKEDDRLFRLKADLAQVLVWTSGPDKACTYFNRHWLDFTGRPVRQERDAGWAEGVHCVLAPERVLSGDCR
jgi:PAS domain-containing protein